MPPSYEIECPNYKTGCDIENCPRLLENVEVEMGADGELVGSGFCSVKGGRFFGGIGKEKIKFVQHGEPPSRTSQPAVSPVGEFKPIKFEWRGPMVERFRKLEERLTPQPDPWTADNDIDYVAYCAYDYYRVLTDWVSYLRGEADEKPAPVKRPNVGEQNVGDWMVGTIKPTILDPMKRLIENLPTLNTADGKYPFKRIDEMFEALNLLAFILNHCEEELQSDVGSSMGLAAKTNYELHMLACPEKTLLGKVVLERKLIAEAFERFYKAFCGAAWALKDKVAKRESGKIDLTKLDKDIIMQQDKDHPEHELLQIEIDILYCLPEASPWLFLRICRVMSKALERAKEDLDAELPNYRWFAEGLSMIVRGLGHTTGEENEIDCDRVEIREALRNLVSALIRWQTMCVTNGMAKPDLINRIVKKLTLPYGDLDEETPGAYDRFIEDMFFEGSEGCLHYRPGPLKSILETCEDELVDWKLLPEDITSHVCENSIFFIEENDMGWYDADRDEFMSNAITRIYSRRHPKADNPDAEHERKLAEYLGERLKEAAVDIAKKLSSGRKTGNGKVEGKKRGKKSGRTGDAYDQFIAAKKLYEDPKSTFFHNANGAATKVLGWIGTAKDGKYQHTLAGYSRCGTYSGVKSLARQVSRSCTPTGDKRRPGRKLKRRK